MKNRNLEYENKFRKYLFSFDLETHLKICENINVNFKKEMEDCKIILMRDNVEAFIENHKNKPIHLIDISHLKEILKEE